MDRQNYNRNGSFNPNTSFKGNYYPDNFRIGAVYDVALNISVYASYSTGEDPPGSNLFLTNKGDFNGLSHSHKEEVGIKIDPWKGRFISTFALYNIERNHILANIDRNTLSDAGSQFSRGFEWEGAAWMLP